VNSNLLSLEESLTHGDLKIIGRLVDASNATLLAEVTNGEEVVKCIYKPTAGERPLWDFTRGSLSRREVATFKLAKAAGLEHVPLTVLRADGPLGGGMAQLWLEGADYQTLVRIREPYVTTEPYLQVLHARGANGEDVVVEHLDDPRLRELALFDLVTNNADRKGGHLFIANDSVWAVDHGLTWHEEPKQRTVLWGWAGEAFTERDAYLLTRMRDNLVDTSNWAEVLTNSEITAAIDRVEELIDLGHFPRPLSSEPNIPWPVF
jgi:uncharacterized repeat protein (TIGR03843 family)